MVPDFGNFFNAISPMPDPPPVPSKVSFEVRWEGGGDVQEIEDATFGFRGEYVTGDASISFRCQNEHSDVEYRSDPEEQSNVGSPGVGTEQNGVYF